MSLTASASFLRLSSHKDTLGKAMQLLFMQFYPASAELGENALVDFLRIVAKDYTTPHFSKLHSNAQEGICKFFAFNVARLSTTMIYGFITLASATVRPQLPAAL